VGHMPPLWRRKMPTNGKCRGDWSACPSATGPPAYRLTLQTGSSISGEHATSNICTAWFCWR
jgi:glycine cleavage system pyridoxal-binding protein P